MDRQCDFDQEYQTWEFHLWTLLKFPTLSKNTIPLIITSTIVVIIITLHLVITNIIVITITNYISEDIIDVDIAVEDLVVKNISTFETKQV